MKFYPQLSLYRNYTTHLPPSLYFSARIPDDTLRTTLDGMNYAMNLCDHMDSFMDFGAGNGRYSAALLPEFKRGYGVEIVHDAMLEKLGKKNTTYTVMFGKLQPQKLKEKLDFIILMDVIEHIPEKDVGRFIQMMKNALRVGGVIYVVTPNAVHCGPAEKSGIYFKRHKFGHHKQYAHVELKALFESQHLHEMFVRFEDAPLRLLIKDIMLGLSFMDKKYIEPHVLLRVVTEPLIWCFRGMSRVMGWVVDQNENHHTQDEFNTRTISAAYKKMK